MDARPLVSLLVLALAWTPIRASGAPLVELKWSAPTGCPDGAAVLDELERLAPAAPASAVPLRSHGAIVREGELWRLRLEVESGGESGVRELHDGSCIRLAQVAALSLALALETRVPPPAPKTVSDADLAPPRWLVRAFLGGDLGSLRAPSPGPGLAVGLFFGRTRLELSAAYWFPQRASGLEIQLVAGGLHACHALTEELEIGLCAGVEGGRMQASYLETGASVVHGWLGLTGGVAVGWSFTAWLALRAEVGVGMTLVAPELGPADEERGPAPVFGRAGLGVEARFR